MHGGSHLRYAWREVIAAVRALGIGSFNMRSVHSSIKGLGIRLVPGLNPSLSMVMAKVRSYIMMLTDYGSHDARVKLCE